MKSEENKIKELGIKFASFFFPGRKGGGKKFEWCSSFKFYL